MSRFLEVTINKYVTAKNVERRVNGLSDARERSSGKVRKRRSRLWLILSNVVLIASAVVFIIAYSTYVRKEQRNTRTDAFISTVESMKQISTNNIVSERGYVNNWASYITERGMTVDEALDYIRIANTQPDIQAHIVDMETYEARSTYIGKDGD